MGKNLKKLEEAELEIMEVVWNSGNPVTSNYTHEPNDLPTDYRYYQRRTNHLANKYAREYISYIFSKNCIIIRYRI